MLITHCPQNVGESARAFAESLRCKMHLDHPFLAYLVPFSLSNIKIPTTTLHLEWDSFVVRSWVGIDELQLVGLIH